jgi:hypothetical protein
MWPLSTNLTNSQMPKSLQDIHTTHFLKTHDKKKCWPFSFLPHNKRYFEVIKNVGHFLFQMPLSLFKKLCICGTWQLIPTIFTLIIRVSSSLLLYIPTIIYSTIKSILHLDLNHSKYFFTSKPFWKIIVEFSCWLLGSSSTIDTSYHTPCINAKQCLCVVLNLVAIAYPFAWYSGNTIRTHFIFYIRSPSSSKTKKRLLALVSESFSDIASPEQFLFTCPYFPHFQNKLIQTEFYILEEFLRMKIYPTKFCDKKKAQKSPPPNLYVNFCLSKIPIFNHLFIVFLNMWETIFKSMLFWNTWSTCDWRWIK